MNKRQKRELIKIIISLVLFFSLLICSSFINIFKDKEYIQLIVYIIVYIFASYEIIIKAIKNIFKAQFLDENFLMLIATIGAFILGEYNEALAVILFYEVGEFFQGYAVNKSRTSITELMELAPDYANIIKDNVVEEVDPCEVKIGDVILVKPGEKIPVDGIVIEGESSLDVKALTGESIYKDIIIGDEVLSGMVNITGTLKIKAEKEYLDSTAAKILELVENATSMKSNPEKFITKFAKYYTPIIVILAIMLAVIPGLITNEWSKWIYRALNFLVVSCPCALVISIPLSFFTGIGKASKMGVLIKGSSYIEELNKANIFIFDKTGTITKGNFVVSEIVSVYDEEELLRCAMIAEGNSNHPIALSIKKYYKDKYTESFDYLNYQIAEISGKGVIAKGSNEEILCGNEKLLKAYSIDVPSYDFIGTIIHIALNQKYLGSIIINDEIKENALSLIECLNQNKFRTIILSGDNKEIVKNVQRKIGITESYASLLPNQKLEKLEEIQRSKNDKDVICFVGDGINDAPALVKADIGISMGLKGTDAAIESSDIVIMDDNLLSIIKMKLLSKLVMNVVYQNIVLALSIKMLVLVLSGIGLSNMWLAIFADVGVAVIAILNALRINLFKN